MGIVYKVFIGADNMDKALALARGEAGHEGPGAPPVMNLLNWYQPQGWVLLTATDGARLIADTFNGEMGMQATSQVMQVEVKLMKSAHWRRWLYKMTNTFLKADLRGQRALMRNCPARIGPQRLDESPVAARQASS